MKYDVVKKNIEGLDKRGGLGGFNQNKMRDIYQGF